MLSVGHLRLTQYYKNNVGSIHDHHTGILENQEAKAYTVKNSNWIVQKLNQSILKEINPEYSLEELTLKLKFQFFGHLMRRADSLEKTLMLGKIEGRRRRGRHRMRWLDGITDSMDMSLSKLRETGKPGKLQSMGLQRVNTTERLNNKAQRQEQRAEHVHAKKKKKISDNS